MATPIYMPQPGQMTEACVLLAWHKQEGDEVRKGDVLFEIETDKANMDVEAFDEGVLLRQLVAPGTSVPVNSICGYIGAAGEEVPATATAPTTAPAPTEVPVPAAPLTAESPPPGPTDRPDGAVAEPAEPPAQGASGDDDPNPRSAKVSPRAVRVAAELGVDPATVTGTGPNGRITERDIRAAADLVGGRERPPTTPARVAIDGPGQAPATADPGGDGPRPMSRIRRVIAQRLTDSVATIPQFRVTVSVDASRLVKIRERYRAEGMPITVTDLVVAASAQALREFPQVNSRTDGQVVWARQRVHVGVAVTIPDGLLVPVVRDADRRSIEELHEDIAALVTAAREGTLAPDDMTGGTFTVSNLGMYDVEDFTALINPGESAILAVSSIIPTPVAVAEGIAVRSVMRLTLSADHRLVDGEMAARFLNSLRRRLEDADGLARQLLNG